MLQNPKTDNTTPNYIMLNYDPKKEQVSSFFKSIFVNKTFCAPEREKTKPYDSVLKEICMKRQMFQVNLIRSP
jgi:hypothetical protein